MSDRLGLHSQSMGNTQTSPDSRRQLNSPLRRRVQKRETDSKRRKPQELPQERERTAPKYFF
jgi:hypothetical protein